MTQVDFREPSMLERLVHWIQGAMRNRPALYLNALVGLLFAAEATRLVMAQRHLWDLEARRESIANRVSAVKTREAALHGLGNTLDQALRLRRTSSRLAAEIGEIGDALAPDLALTIFRTTEIGQTGESVEIDGLGAHVSDVIRTLRQLSVTGSFELEREDATDGAISFRFGMHAGRRYVPR
jgi:hypothetical protein